MTNAAIMFGRILLVDKKREVDVSPAVIAVPTWSIEAIT